MNNVKRKVEAVLFSAGNNLNVEEIRKLCRATLEEVKQALSELKGEYDEKNSSIMLVEGGDFWKFTVREQFIPVVRKIVAETELSKSILETLAVIAFKYPILQSDLIKIRTNKAYDHLVELEKLGYITRQKYSRTNLIKLTERFFQYFDLTQEKLKRELKSFDGIAKAIKDKEIDVENAKELQKKAAEEAKKMDEKIKEDIEKLDKAEEDYQVPVQVYESKEEAKAVEQKEENKKEKLGELDVVENLESNEDVNDSSNDESDDSDKDETDIENRGE